MNEGNHITPTYIQAYLAGELSRKETYSFEKELLRNSALSDTVEGFRTLNEQKIAFSPIQQALQKRLNKRIAEEKKGILPFQAIQWVAAAAVLLFCGTLGYWWGAKQENSTIYQAVPNLATHQESKQQPSLEPQLAARTYSDKPLVRLPPSLKNIPEVTMVKTMPKPEFMLLEDANDSLITERLKATSFVMDTAKMEVVTAIQKPTTTFDEDMPEQDSVRNILSESLFYIYSENDSPLEEDAKGRRLALAIASPKASSKMKKDNTAVKNGSRFVIETGTQFIMSDGDRPKSRMLMVKSQQQKGWQYDPANHNAQPTVSPDDYTLYLQKSIYALGVAPMKGMVKVRFRVNKDGTLSRFTILKSLTKEQDEKAIEIIRGGPNWMPKINDGFVSKQWVTQDITF